MLISGRARGSRQPVSQGLATTYRTIAAFYQTLRDEMFLKTLETVLDG